MKALSLTQPWATLVATGAKRVETRSWSTKYRGPLAIHAAKRFPRHAAEFAATERALGRLPARIPSGAVIAIVRLVDVKRTEDVVQGLGALERFYGDYEPGRFAWFLEDVRKLPEPIPARGALGLFEVELARSVLEGIK